MRPEEFWGLRVCQIIKYIWAHTKKEEQRSIEQKFLYDLIRWAGWNNYAYTMRAKKTTIHKPEKMYPFPWDNETKGEKKEVPQDTWDVLKSWEGK